MSKRKNFLAGIIILLIVAITGSVFAEIDVLFQDDFENLNAGDTPDFFQPTGSGNPDWDNAIFNPESALIAANEIDTGNIGGNTTRKYKLDLDITGAPGNSKPVLLGANFNPSTDQFVIVEYDVFLTSNAGWFPCGEIYYVDGYDDLDGSGSTKIAIHISFSEHQNISGDTANDVMYYTTGQDNNVTTDDGTEISLGFFWSINTWYRVQVIANQENRTFDIKVTDKSTGISQTATGLPFNDANAGYIRKVWFVQSTTTPELYVDNVYIYQDTSAPPVNGPTITFQEYTKGPVKANIGLDIDFADDTDLQFIQYKIGSGGTWKDLTNDGTATFDLSGVADTSITAPVFITNADFNSLIEGENRIYFKATDNDGFITESAGYLSFFKDTTIPNTATITTPNSFIIDSLTAIKGFVGDAVSGVGANSATFTLQRTDNSEYWNGTGWQAGLVNLSTTHFGTSDGTVVAWTNGVSLPSDTGVTMTVSVSVDDNLGNGIFTGASFSFTVNPGFPEITIWSSSVGPVKTNTGMDVDFSDDTDLASIRYKIGTGGTWTNFTSDGSTIIDLSGPADTTITQLVWITDADFAALPQGISNIYFNATDNVPNENETEISVVFKKDDLPPALATVTAPATDPFSSLPTVAGQIADNASGFGFAADSATFTIQRDSDSQYWTGTTWGIATDLATTHSETTDNNTVNWVKNDPIPTLTDLTTGVIYTFTIKITDRAGNTTSNPFPFTFEDVPEIATVTDPIDNSYTNTPFSISGRAADHEGGSGLNADSTNFTLKRSADSNYWNGSGWQPAVSNLATTHSATTGSQQVTWTPSGALPVAMDLTDGAYIIQATVTNINAGTLTGDPVTVHYDASLPGITSGAMAADNSYVTIVFSEMVWGDATQSTAMTPADFTVNFQQNTGAVTGASIANFYEDAALTTLLSATTGYATVYAKLNNTGGPATGVETIEITANAASVYDMNSNAMAATETTGVLNYNGLGVTITARETEDTDANGKIDRIKMTASEALNDTFGGITATVGAYVGIGFDTGTPNDSIFYITFTESGTPDTGATPDVQITANTTLMDNATGTKLVVVDPAVVTSTDTAPPVLVSASSSQPVSSGNLLTGTVLTLTFSEDINTNSAPGAMSAADFKVEPDGATVTADLDGATATVALGANNELDVTFTGPTISGIWTSSGEIDLDTFTNVKDNATTPNSAVENGALTEVPISGLAGVTIISRETEDTDADGQIDRIKMTASEALNDVFSGFTATVSGYGGISYSTGVANDSVFYILFTESVTPDTGATPDVQITANTTLMDDATGTMLVVVDPAVVTSTDTAPPVLVSASSSQPVSSGNLLTGTVLTLSFSEDINTNSAPGVMSAADFKVEPDGTTSKADLDGATATVALGANNELNVTFTGPTISGIWTANGEIDLDIFTNVKDNATTPNSAVENGALTEVPISGLAGVTIISRETEDTDADGQIDRIKMTASEALNDDFTSFTATVAGYGGISYSTGVANDSVFYILFTESGTPDTGVTPDVQITVNTSLKDNATGLKLVVIDPAAVTSTDTSAPIIGYTLSVADKNQIFVHFSEMIYDTAPSGGIIDAANFAYAGAAAVASISPITSSGNGTKEVILNMNGNITAAEIVAQTSLNITIEDQVGLNLVNPIHRVTDVGLGLVGNGIMEPLWARDETQRDTVRGGIGLLKKFDGSGWLRDQDIILHAHLHNTLAAAAETKLYFDSDVPSSLITNGLWLPDATGVYGLVPGSNPNDPITEESINGQLLDFLIQESTAGFKDGELVGFFFELPAAVGLFHGRIINDSASDWYRYVRPWAFKIRDVRVQRGDVSILSNVINPTQGQTTKLHYTIASAGMVTIQVFDLEGDIIDVLYRGRRNPGDYSTTWDGRNRGGRVVARGIYFIKVVAPGINEIRKVLVVK